MSSLERYRAFVEIVDRGSLTAAARHLGVSLQSVSRALTGLEGDLGVELVRRTTRRLQPTAAGLAFQARIKAALTEIEHACAEIGRDSARIAGTLRVGAPVLFAPRYVVPPCVAFLERHPELKIDLVLSDTVANLVDDRLDVAIRIGDPGPPQLKIRPLAHLRRVMFAAPEYLARRGVPHRPEDLADHVCVIRAFGPDGDSWPLVIDGRPTRVPVRGTLRCDDANAANAAVAAGAGLGIAPLWQIQADLDRGRLTIVLADFEPPPIPVQAVWLGAAGTPVRTSLFVEALALHFASEGLRTRPFEGVG